MRYFVWAAGFRSSTQVHPRSGLEPSISAAVEKHLRLVSDDSPVLLDSGLEPDNGSVARVTRCKFLYIVAGAKLNPLCTFRLRGIGA
jgi:hypothetical protein